MQLQVAVHAQDCSFFRRCPFDGDYNSYPGPTAVNRQGASSAVHYRLCNPNVCPSLRFSLLATKSRSYGAQIHVSQTRWPETKQSLAWRTTGESSFKALTLLSTTHGIEAYSTYNIRVFCTGSCRNIDLRLRASITKDSVGACLYAE